MEIISFYLGISFIYLNGLISGLGFLSICILKPQIKPFVGFILGLLYALYHEHNLSLPSLEIPLKPGNARVEISSIPVFKNNKYEFNGLAFVDFNAKPIHIKFDCTRLCKDFRVGDSYQLFIKYRPIQAPKNPGQKDMRPYFKAWHLAYKASVLKIIKPLAKKTYFIETLREKLSQNQKNVMVMSSTLGIWQALTLGLTSALTAQEWDIFRQTGTTHLMVISGAHVGLVAMMVFNLANWVWRRFAWGSLRLPSKRFAMIWGIMGAFLYTLIAGLGVPAQRAMLGLCVGLSRYVLPLRFHPWQAWRVGLLGVLLGEPHAVLMPGFYLSFIAVCILILTNQRIHTYKSLAVQGACMIGLLPLTLFWFSYGSISGLFANLVAIPWVSFILVPLALITLIMTSVVPWPILTYPLSYAIKGLMYFLSVITQINFINLNLTMTSFSWVLAAILCLWCFITLPYKRILVLGPFLVGLYGYTHKPNFLYPLELNVLDVGQGLSVAIHTKAHTLIYDTGLKYFKGGDSAKSVIIPYLQNRHLHHVDAIVVSHPDLDHRGGLASLQAFSPKARLITNQPSFYHEGENCHAMKPWVWDHIRFKFFPLPSFNKRNDTSCVLSVCAKRHCVLLTGDIEKRAERYLVRHFSKQLRSDVIVVPHHASKSSSSGIFIDKVKPYYAIASYGRDNRYHFPHFEAIQTYQFRNIPLFDTMTGGMISVFLSPAGGRIESYI